MHSAGVIAYPTEAVWGLGYDPFSEKAVNKILGLKERHVDKGLILVASRIDQLTFLLEGLPPEKLQTLKGSWPGPYTWIVPHHERIPRWISGQHDGVAVRVSKHPVVTALCDLYGGPIVSTSANPQGKPAAVHAWQVQRYFGKDSRLNLITQGVVGQRRQPSEIRDLLTMAVLRGG